MGGLINVMFLFRDAIYRALMRKGFPSLPDILKIASLDKDADTESEPEAIVKSELASSDEETVVEPKESTAKEEQGTNEDEIPERTGPVTPSESDTSEYESSETVTAPDDHPDDSQDDGHQVFKDPPASPTEAQPGPSSPPIKCSEDGPVASRTRLRKQDDPRRIMYFDSSDSESDDPLDWIPPAKRGKFNTKVR